MVTCKKCGTKGQGVWFKNKICPKCDTPQDSKYSKEIIDLDELGEIETLDISEQKPIVSSEHKLDSYRLPQTSEIMSETPTLDLEDNEIGARIEKKDKMSFSKEHWEIITRRIYFTLEKMLFDMNPEFYGSEEAQELRKLNQEVTAMVLSQKEINPIWVMLLGQIIYIIPAIVGSRKKKKEEKPFKKEFKQVDDKKAIDPEPQPTGK